MNLRKLLRVLHRDMGYFIVGMTIVYALSGIYLNHRHDFNPDYRIIFEEFEVAPGTVEDFNLDRVKEALSLLEQDVVYKKHYVTNQENIKVFIENGEVTIDPDSGAGAMHYLKRRPVIFEMNKLHKASLGSLWKWVSDVMAVILIFVAVSGLFLLKGKRGLGRWGWWFVIAGIAVPLLFAILYI
jgi:uncharacterized protein